MKLTPEEINRAIAELMGAKWHWTFDRKKVFLTFRENDGEFVKDGEKTPPKNIYTGPNYFADLNACREMEETLSKERIDVRSLYYDFLALTVPTWPKRRNDTFEHDYAMVTATAPQRCEAFLKTMGKWVE